MADPVNPQPWWALAGVIVGFSLGEGSRYLRYRWEIYRDKRLVQQELRAVLSQIHQKDDILQQAIAKLRERQFLPTLSVRVITTGYGAVLSALYPHLSLIERNCLHVVYERLRVADETMESFEKDFLGAVREKVLTDPWTAYADRLEDIRHSLSVVEQLAKSYLAGTPIDVFGILNTGS